MGLLWFVALGGATLVLLYARGLRGGVLMLAAAGLAFAGAGYAIQGVPALQGAPRANAARVAPIALTTARTALMGRFDSADSWLLMSDALASRGNTRDAAAVLQSAVRRDPRNFKLWVGLGNALADHGRTLSPASRFAFERARGLAPAHPAPPFFLGLAAARSGDRETALREWQAILADAPAEASWRPLVEDALLTLRPRPEPTVRPRAPSSPEANR